MGLSCGCTLPWNVCSFGVLVDHLKPSGAVHSSTCLLFREADQKGKIRWRNGVLCSLSAEKSGIFLKTGRKQAGQIVWCLDSFKAQNELNRHAEVVLKSQSAAPT